MTCKPLRASAVLWTLLLAQSAVFASAPAALRWRSPCAFSYTDGKPYGETVPAYVCDYAATKDPKAQSAFSESSPQAQKEFLHKTIAAARDAYDGYRTGKAALLDDTKPDESGDVTDGSLAKLRRDRARIDDEGLKIAKPFAANPSPYVKDFYAREQALDGAIAKQEKALGVKHEEQARKIENVFKEGKGKGLKEANEALSKDGADASAVGNALFDAQGGKSGGSAQATKSGLPQLSGAAAGSAGGALEGSGSRYDNLHEEGIAAPPAGWPGAEAPLTPEQLRAKAVEAENDGVDHLVEADNPDTPWYKRYYHRAAAAGDALAQNYYEFSAGDGGKVLKEDAKYYQDSADADGKDGVEGFAKLGKEHISQAFLVADYVKEKTPEVIEKAPAALEKAAVFSGRVVMGDPEANEEAAVGTYHFVKSAAVGVADSVSGAWNADKGCLSLGAQSTTYDCLKATEKTVGVVATVGAPIEGGFKLLGGGAAEAAVAEGLGTAGAKTAVEETAAAAKAASATESALAAGKETASASQPMMAAVERAGEASAEAGKTTESLASQTETGSKWFDKGSVKEVPPEKVPPVEAPGASAASGSSPYESLRGKSPEEIDAHYNELAERSYGSTGPEKEALERQRGLVYEYKVSQELAQSPEFQRIKDLPIPAEDKQRLVKELVETRVNPAFEQTDGKVSRLSNELLAQVPASSGQAGIADLAQAQTLEGRLLQSRAGGSPLYDSKDSFRQAYRDTLNGRSLDSANAELWAKAAQRGEGEFVETSGGQYMPKQTRGTCPYTASCNLFHDDIAAGKLETKDVLREAYDYNPKFASRDPTGAITENGLKDVQVREMVQKTASQVGKTAAPVPAGDMVAFMQEEKKPVLVMINSGENGHVMVVGKPFTMETPQGTQVVFHTFDGNNPTGVAGFIDAKKLGALMKGDGVAVVENDSPWAAKTAEMGGSDAKMAAAGDRVLTPTPQVAQEIARLKASGAVTEQGLGKAIAQRASEMGDQATALRQQAGQYGSGSAQYKQLMSQAGDLDARSKELYRYSSAAFTPRVDAPASFASVERRAAVSAAADDAATARVYEASPKHELGNTTQGVKGTPMPFDSATSRKLLESAIPSADKDGGKVLYNIEDKRIVVFRVTNGGTFHGYELPASDVPDRLPNDVLKAFRDNGSITNAEYNKLRKGQALVP